MLSYNPNYTRPYMKQNITNPLLNPSIQHFIIDFKSLQAKDFSNAFDFLIPKVKEEHIYNSTLGPFNYAGLLNNRPYYQQYRAIIFVLYKQQLFLWYASDFEPEHNSTRYIVVSMTQETIDALKLLKQTIHSALSQQSIKIIDVVDDVIRDVYMLNNINDVPLDYRPDSDVFLYNNETYDIE